MKKIIIGLLLNVFSFIFLSGAALAADLNLSVAASLKEAVSQISDDFTKKNFSANFLKNYASSGALAKQIENGAPCDVFFSANVEWMDYLKGKNMVDDTNLAIFAFNELVFVGKPELKVGNIQDIVKLDKVAIGSPKSVPAGEYAMAALKKAGFDTKFEKKLVIAKDVRECLMYADRGEVSGAFVYKTDVAMAQNVKILFIVPQELYPRVTYPVALTVTGSRKAEAVAFFKYLQSSEAKAVLAKYGFAVK